MRKSAADEESWSLHYENGRKPLLSAWQYAGICWGLVCLVAFVFLLFRSQ